jgi:hypothetical protein
MLTLYKIVIYLFYATYCTHFKDNSSGTAVGDLRLTIHRAHPSMYWVYGAVFIW